VDVTQVQRAIDFPLGHKREADVERADGRQKRCAGGSVKSGTRSGRREVGRSGLWI